MRIQPGDTRQQLVLSEPSLNKNSTQGLWKVPHHTRTGFAIIEVTTMAEVHVPQVRQEEDPRCPYALAPRHPEGPGRTSLGITLAVRESLHKLLQGRGNQCGTMKST